MNKAQAIALNLQRIWREILPVELIAVSKYSTPEEVSFAYHAGQKDFGENRVQDLIEKVHYFEQEDLNDVQWHFIGHLQSNKVKELFKIKRLHSIHSIDSLKLLNELFKKESEAHFDQCHLFLQVNTSKEEEKSGFESVEDLSKAIEDIIAAEKKGSKFIFRGLMTMATIRTDQQELEAARCFKELYDLKLELEKKYQREIYLSMGMSQDYHIALQFHSNYVRIGSSIFKMS